MKNKILINKLKDNAELAMAAYGYFHLADSKYDFNKDNRDKKRLKYFRDIKRDELIKQNPNTTDQELQNTYPTHADILNMEYKYFKDKKTKEIQNGFFDDDFLGGDMTPTQAKRFFERYDILIHQPNTESGFSATLFQNKESKEFTLAIISTESKCDGIK